MEGRIITGFEIPAQGTYIRKQDSFLRMVVLPRLDLRRPDVHVVVLLAVQGAVSAVTGGGRIYTAVPGAQTERGHEKDWCQYPICY